MAVGSLSLAVLGLVREKAEDESWTVLYYAMADTNLEPDMMADVGEMGEVGSQDGLDIVALVDRSPDYTDESVLGLGDWVGAKVLEVGERDAEVTEDLGVVNTGDPAVLEKFVTDGLRDHPADHYALVFSDHGASWPGLGPDDSAQDTLTLPELTQAVGQGLAANGVDQLDLIGFDACLMGTYEVADKVAPLAQRMLASEELEPGHGWDYTSLDVLAEDEPASADRLGKELVNGFRSQAKAEETDSSITLSLVNLDKMDELQAAVGDLSTALAANVGEIAPHVARDRAKTLTFARMPDPHANPHMADLGDLVEDIDGGVADVEEKAEVVQQRLDDVVVREIEGDTMTGATGLSIYFPPYAEFYRPEYVEAAGASDWSRFLDIYYATGAAVSVPPKFTNADGAPEIDADAEGVLFSGTLDPSSEKNFAEAFVDIGVVEDDGSITNVAEVKASPERGDDDEDNEVAGEFDYTVLTLSDGTASTPAFLQVGEEMGTGTLSIPLGYYEPGQAGVGEPATVQVRLPFDPESGEVGEPSYFVYDEDAETFGEFNADPDGAIVAVLPNIAADGTTTWVPQDETLRADLDAVEADFERLETGTDLELKLSVKDFAGNDTTISGRTTVPEPDSDSDD